MAEDKRIYAVLVGAAIIIVYIIVFTFYPVWARLLVVIVFPIFVIGLLIIWIISASRYVHKTCFLGSDKDWKSVLGLVPIAYRKRPPSFLLFSFVDRIQCPLLIYHEENIPPPISEHVVDADSVLDFLEKYEPGRIYLVGDEHTELDRLILDLMGGEEQVIRLSRDDYEEFWGEFYRFVVVDSNDYETALMASVFASKESVPLFFTDKLPENVDGKTAILIGSNADGLINDLNNRGCDKIQEYTLDVAIAEYVKNTNTNKIILVNPDDLNRHHSVHTYIPEKTALLFEHLYAKGSLAAPILAAGREEIILFPPDNKDLPSSYDAVVTEANEKYGITPKYLTVIGNPDAVPQSEKVDSSWPISYHRLELDGRMYGSYNDGQKIDLATGRIYGVSPSDVSGNIARSLFYEALPRNRYALVIPREDHNDELQLGQYQDKDALTQLYRSKYWTPEVENEFDAGNTEFYAGSTGVSGAEERIRDKYLEVNFILYSGHGNVYGYPDLINAHTNWHQFKLFLTCPVVINNACNTARWHDVSGPHPENIRRWQFAMQSIRRGAIAQIAVASEAYWHQMWDVLLNQMYLQGKSVGEAFKCARNAEWDRDPMNFSYNNEHRGDPWFFLMGDPVFAPKY